MIRLISDLTPSKLSFERVKESIAMDHAESDGWGWGAQIDEDEECLEEDIGSKRGTKGWDAVVDSM